MPPGLRRDRSGGRTLTQPQPQRDTDEAQHGRKAERHQDQLWSFEREQHVGEHTRYSESMWDPEQLAEIPVIADRLLAAGDPLGEWLAIRMRLDPGMADQPERRLLRQRARVLRDQLGPRLILADDPRLGRPHAIRELGLLADVSFERVTADRLAELLTRPDAPFLLRLQLRGEVDALRDCVELLQEGAGTARGTRASLRQLVLSVIDAHGEPDAASSSDLLDELGVSQIGERMPSLFTIEVDRRSLALPFDMAVLDGPSPWSSRRRAALGRALSSPVANVRQAALLRLREHGEDAGALRVKLLAIIESDPHPEVRAAALGVVMRLGALVPTMLALLTDIAHEKDDPQLREWLKLARRR
jgi:hypothetical protein